MRFSQIIVLSALALPATVGAFSSVSAISKPSTNTRYETFPSLFATEEEAAGSGESQEQPVTPQVPPAMATPPPPVPPKRLDPLLASLTRVDPATANAPTRNVPLLGEITVAGSMTVLLPAAAIGFLGFVFSIVVAVNSSDELVATLSQVPEQIEQQANEKVNRVYDPNVCRGLCSTQDQDLDGLRSFMESLRK